LPGLIKEEKLRPFKGKPFNVQVPVVEASREIIAGRNNVLDSTFGMFGHVRRPSMDEPPTLTAL
jgi:hypothetical protein